MAVIVVQGQPGSSGAYEYDSGPDPVASHVINHDLHFRPNVSAFIRGTNQPINGVILHHSVDQLEIVFNSPHAIVARLS